MNKLALIALVILSVSCGEDVGSNKKGSRPLNSAPTTTTPGATAEVVTRPMSGAARARSTVQLSTTQEINQAIANTIPSSYRFVPDMSLDDEGSDKNVVTMTALGRPNTLCGSAANLTNIDARIADCLAKNPSHSSWSGLNYGSAGEGDWKLVSLSPIGKEVWLDVRTGLVWSDMIASANWCKASGNTNQMTINCAVEGENMNFCELQNTDMNLNIKWRLPTRNDFLQADIHGSRLVLSTGNFWTATLDSKSSTRSKAWLYNQDQGLLSSDILTNLHQVRCVGAPVRQ